jgi:dihydroxyacetone kinase-like protein
MIEFCFKISYGEVENVTVTLRQMKNMLLGGAASVIAARDELTDIDSRFGDADHGITMEKIMKALGKAVDDSGEDCTILGLLNAVSMAVMTINGGSAVPLWTTLFDGLAEGAPDRADMSEEEFRAMFRSGYETLFELSKAKMGDKTMMDALEPAVEALGTATGSLADMMKTAARAAEAGAGETVNFAARFGRAKNYGERSIGTPDAGAMSMKYFFQGLSEGLDRDQ